MKLKKELNKLKGLPLGSGVKDQMPVYNATKSKQKSALTLYFLLQIFVLIFVPRTEAEQPTNEGSPVYMRKPNSPRCRNKKYIFFCSIPHEPFFHFIQEILTKPTSVSDLITVHFAIKHLEDL